jgi:hypothetical protein
MRYKGKNYKIGDYVIITEPSTKCFRSIPIFRITEDSRVIYDSARKEKCIIITNDATNEIEAAIGIRKLSIRETNKVSDLSSKYNKTADKLQDVRMKLLSSYTHEAVEVQDPFIHDYTDSRNTWRTLARTTIKELTNQLTTYEQILCMYR